MTYEPAPTSWLPSTGTGDFEVRGAGSLPLNRIKNVQPIFRKFLSRRVVVSLDRSSCTHPKGRPVRRPSKHLAAAPPGPSVTVEAPTVTGQASDGEVLVADEGKLERKRADQVRRLRGPRRRPSLAVSGRMTRDWESAVLGVAIAFAAFAVVLNLVYDPGTPPEPSPAAGVARAGQHIQSVALARGSYLAAQRRRAAHRRLKPKRRHRPQPHRRRGSKHKPGLSAPPSIPLTSRKPRQAAHGDSAQTRRQPIPTTPRATPPATRQRAPAPAAPTSSAPRSRPREAGPDPTWSPAPRVAPVTRSPSPVYVDASG